MEVLVLGTTTSAVRAPPTDQMVYNTVQVVPPTDKMVYNTVQVVREIATCTCPFFSIQTTKKIKTEK